MIVVLHRERSEKLASRFTDTLADGGADGGVPWRDLAADEKEAIVRVFDALIQEGLIGEREPTPGSHEAGGW